MFCLNVYLFAMCVLGTCGGQKKTLDPLELEFEVVVSFHAGSGD